MHICVYCECRIVRFLFSLVAQSRSSETFVALCLLVVLGTGALTDWCVHIFTEIYHHYYY